MQASFDSASERCGEWAASLCTPCLWALNRFCCRHTPEGTPESRAVVKVGYVPRSMLDAPHRDSIMEPLSHDTVALIDYPTPQIWFETVSVMMTGLRDTPRMHATFGGVTFQCAPVGGGKRAGLTLSASQVDASVHETRVSATLVMPNKGALVEGGEDVCTVWLHARNEQRLFWFEKIPPKIFFYATIERTEGQ